MAHCDSIGRFIRRDGSVVPRPFRRGYGLLGIGGFELFLILLFGFLLFGPDKLPAMARTVGRGIAKFKSAQEEMNNVIKNDLYDPDSDEPFKNPVEALDKLAAKHDKSGKSTAASKSASGTKASDKPAAETHKPSVTPRQESFTERKARYERERAARRAAEEAAAAGGAAAAKETAAAAGGAAAASASDAASGKAEGSAKPAEATELAAVANPAEATEPASVANPAAAPAKAGE